MIEIAGLLHQSLIYIVLILTDLKRVSSERKISLYLALKIRLLAWTRGLANEHAPRLCVDRSDWLKTSRKPLKVSQSLHGPVQ